MELDTIIIIVAIFATQLTAIVYLSARIDKLSQRVGELDNRITKLEIETKSGFQQLGIEINFYKEHVNKYETSTRERTDKFI